MFIVIAYLTASLDGRCYNLQNSNLFIRSVSVHLNQKVHYEGCS